MLQQTGAVRDRIPELSEPVGEESVLPVRYPRPLRLRLTVRHAAIAVVTLALLIGIIVVTTMVRSHAVNSTFPAYSLTAGSSESASFNHSPPEGLPEGGSAAGIRGMTPRVHATGHTPADPTGDPSAQHIVVSVVGHVEHPGLCTLAPGARVADALSQAGVRPEARVEALNAAQRVSDGQQFYVPGPGDPPGWGDLATPSGASGREPTAPSIAGGLININSATAAELTTLPGIGQATASAIVEHRTQVGGFTSLEQLQEVKGIGPAKFAAVKSKVTL